MDGFPAFTFPFCPKESSKIQTVNYGICPVVDLNIKDEKVEIYQRESTVDAERVTLYTKCPYPLSSPNPHGYFDATSDYDLEITTQGKRFTCSSSITHVDNFIQDYPLEMFSSLFGVLNDSKVDLSLADILDLNKLENMAYRGRRMIDGFDTVHSKGTFCTRNVQALEIYNACMEIPKQLLCDYLSECMMEMQTDEQTGHAFGNCLATVGDCLVYPSGPALDILTISSIELLEFQSEGTKKWPALIQQSSHCQKFQFKGVIREIIASSAPHDDEALICVRSDYFCCFLKIQDLSSQSTQRLVIIHCSHCSDVRLSSVALSPYIRGEAAVSDVKGNVYLLSNDVKECTKIHEVAGVDLNWQLMLFGSSPRRIIAVQSQFILLLDLRNLDTKSSDLLTLPNSMLPNVSALSPACCRHPTCSFQLFVCTTSSVIILDERFPGTALLQVNHYLCAPAKHIFCHVGDERLHVFLGSYKGRELVTMAIANQGESFTLPRFFPSGGAKPCLPWRVVTKPYRFASYDEWSTTKDTFEYPCQRRAIKQRLMQPLIGVCFQTPNRRQDDLLVFQLSRSGDLFWQHVGFAGISEGGTSRESAETFDEDNILTGRLLDENFETYRDRFCQKWVNEILVAEVNENIKTSPCDVHLRRKERVSVLCAALGKKYLELESNSESERCRETNLVHQIKDLRGTSGILTLSKLGREEMEKDPPLPSCCANTNDMLTKVLHENWFSNDYVPLEIPNIK